jgi:cell division protein FtsQ
MVKRKKTLRKNRSKARQAQQRARTRHRVALVFKTVGILAAVPLMALVFIFSHDLITQWDQLNVKTIRITGNHQLTERQILEQAGIHEGQNILSVNLGLVRKRLISHGWIADAAVHRKLPDGLGIKIREHVPAAVINLEPGFLMDARGVVFKKLEAGESRQLPVVSGLGYADLALSPSASTPLMAAVVNLLDICRGADAMLPGRRLKSIAADRETGLTLTMAGRLTTIKIGYDHYPEKLYMLSRISKFTAKFNNLTNIESVDLNNPNRIVLGPVVPDASSANNKEV